MVTLEATAPIPDGGFFVPMNIDRQNLLHELFANNTPAPVWSAQLWLLDLFLSDEIDHDQWTEANRAWSELGSPRTVDAFYRRFTALKRADTLVDLNLAGFSVD